MPAAVSFIAVPGGLGLAILGVIAKKRQVQLFLHLLKVGAWAGLLATGAYDGSRWLVQSTGWFSYDGFRAIPIFGSLMLGLPAETLQAQTAGWFYHFWNGISFAIFYALVAGPVRWPWGLAWGMTLEGLMILSYPMLFGVPLSNFGFWAISLGGHAVYGTVLGLLVQRYGALTKSGDSTGRMWYRR